MRQHSIEANAAVVDHLVTALWNTTMLVDLRLRLYRGNEEAFTRLYRSLLSKRFQLETLFCAESLANTSIVRSHPSLRTLGLFGTRSEYPFPILDSPILVLRISPCIPGHRQDSVTLSPDLIDPAIGNSKSLAERLQTALDADIGKHLPNPPEDVRILRVQLRSFANPMKLRLLLEAAHAIWGEAPRLGICFEMCSSEGLFTEAIAQAIHAFRTTSFLAFSWLGESVIDPPSTPAKFDIRSPALKAYAIKWSEKLPFLESVIYGVDMLYLGPSGNWTML
ncbi:hypothetical protein BKA70DRAFT_1339499 [Coprinopsis sp. MPI-PUGE-AT-0042]|nr:hypothetical protein BKA70DRAFT_1339499 [Coprinopsis sp. MPI-PUGE-AT-0042]